jgi:hypothetical protein
MRNPAADYKPAISIHQNGPLFQADAETGEATVTWDDFFAHKPPMSPQPFALDLSEVNCF